MSSSKRSFGHGRSDRGPRREDGKSGGRVFKKRHDPTQDPEYKKRLRARSLIALPKGVKWYDVELRPLNDEEISNSAAAAAAAIVASGTSANSNRNGGAKENADGKTVDWERMYKKAQKLYEEGDHAWGSYSTPKKLTDKADSRERFLKKITTTGTMRDKIAALIVSAKMPRLALEPFDRLLQTAEKPKPSVRGQYCNALIDLFRDMLPENRKLKHFWEQPYANSLVTDQHMIFWYFESKFKDFYGRFISVVDSLGHSPSSFKHLKQLSINTTALMLREKPEAEQRLLSMLVNKLGDPERKLASKTINELLNLIALHPKMRLVVIREIEVFLHRKNISPRAQYYSVVFLSQVRLSEDEPLVSSKLIMVYFSLFKDLMEQQKRSQYLQRKKAQLERAKAAQRGRYGTARNFRNKYARLNKNDKFRDDSKKKVLGDAPLAEEEALYQRVISAVLIGLSRAFSFVKENSLGEFEAYLKDIYRLAHGSWWSKALIALQLLVQFHAAQSFDGTVDADRFHRLLWRRTGGEDAFDLSHSNTKAQRTWINAVFRVVSRDPNQPRLFGYLKRIVQTSLYQEPAVLASILYTTSEILREQPTATHAISDPSADRRSDYLNALRAANPDIDINAESESSKLQIDDDDVEHFVDADDRDSDAVPDYTHLKDDDDDSDDDDDDDEDDDEEDDDEDAPEIPRSVDVQAQLKSSRQATLDKIKKEEEAEEADEKSNKDEEKSKKLNTEYDGLVRDGRFAHAQGESLWELTLLKDHYHPSVKMFAHKILAGQRVSIPQGSDPLENFSFRSFIDRFVLKNARTRERLHGGFSVRPLATRELANDPNFLANPESSIPADDKYLYHYFNERITRKPSLRKKRAGEKHIKDPLYGSDSDEEFDDEDPDFAGDHDLKAGSDDDADFLEDENFDGSDEDAAAFAAFDGFGAAGAAEGDDEEGEEGEDDDDDDPFIEPTPEELDELLSKELDAELSGKKRKRKRPSEFDKNEDDEDDEDDGDDDDNGDDDPEKKPKRVRYSRYLDADEFERLLEEGNLDSLRRPKKKKQKTT